MAGGEPAKLWPWGKRKIGWVAEGGRGQGWTDTWGPQTNRGLD
jgi:hypothetical protein